MTTITQNPYSFKRNSFLLLGIIWIILGILHYSTSNSDFDLISAVFYPLLGVGYILGHFYYRNTGFIAWDEDKLVLSKWCRKPKEYRFENIENISLTRSYLIIKFPTSKVITFPLGGFKESDIQLLEQSFQTSIA